MSRMTEYRQKRYDIMEMLRRLNDKYPDESRELERKNNMSQYYTPLVLHDSTQSGIGPLTYKQACTLIKIIAWASAHIDCDVTEDEAKELCTAIQYLSNTRPKEEVEE